MCEEEKEVFYSLEKLINYREAATQESKLAIALEQPVHQPPERIDTGDYEWDQLEVDPELHIL